MEGWKKKRKKSLKGGRSMEGVLFLAPSLTGFLVFFFIPFIGGLYYAMVDSPIGGRFVGLDNFRKLLSNESFLKAATNTIRFTTISVPLILVLSLGLALLLAQKIPHSSLFRTIFIMPLVIPVASVVFVWQCLFDYNGWLNGLIHSLDGFAGLAPVDWMKTGLARAVVVIVYIWKNIGYNMVLFLAGLQNIPGEYYESAGMDGAGAWRKFRGITLIYLMPTTFFVFVISVINSFKVFRETYLIAGEYPHDSIYMLQHYMNNMFSSLDYQKLTSAAFLMTAVIALLVYLLFSLERRINRMFN
jgi:multiple sugar transport system permease protein